MADLLSEDDVTEVAEALEPGSTAGLPVYENLWAALFASAVRRSGGQLIANGRFPVQAMLAVLEHHRGEIESTDEEHWPKNVGARQGGWPRLLGPVRRTTATVATTAVIAHASGGGMTAGIGGFGVVC